MALTSVGVADGSIVEEMVFSGTSVEIHMGQIEFVSCHLYTFWHTSYSHLNTCIADGMNNSPLSIKICINTANSWGAGMMVVVIA